jgi:hypothetical protein
LTVRTDGSIGLSVDTLSLRATSAGFNDGQFGTVEINGLNILPNTFARGHTICVLDEARWGIVSIHAFDTYGSLAEATAMRDLLNALPPGTLIAHVVIDDGSQNVVSNPTVMAAIKAFGSVFIDSLGSRDSWAMISTKGTPAGQAREMWRPQFSGKAIIDTTKIVKRSTGTAWSEWMGPASRWDSARVRSKAVGGTIETSVWGVRSDDTQDSIGVSDSMGVMVLAQVDARTHSRLRFKSVITRTSEQDEPQLLGWRVVGQPLGDLVVNRQSMSLSADTVQVGDTVAVSVQVVNVGPDSRDSIVVAILEFGQVVIDSIGPTSSAVAELRIPTFGRLGPNVLNLIVDPEAREVEQSRSNNVTSATLIVLPDTLRPRFQVSVDGRTIVSGDYVRPQPEIRVDIADDGEVPIASPSSVDLRLNGRRVSLSSTTPDSSFESQWAQKTATAILRPQLTRGTHQISVQVTDGSGNPADTAAFVLSFRVETTSDIRDIAPYPNPFPSATNLTFNLTGQILPEEGSVRVYTVAGRLIREIPIGAGEVRSGFNAIAWDGRDGDGDEVANGVYLAVLRLKAGEKWLQETAKLAKLR